MNFNIQIIHLLLIYVTDRIFLLIITDVAVHTPDDFEQILEDHEENDGSKNASSCAEGTGSSNLVDPSSNFNNVFQIFQNVQIVGFLWGIMTHQAPRNMLSSQSSHTAVSEGATSPQEGNPSNLDWNHLTVSHDSSAETEYLENLTQEYKRTQISSEKLQKVTLIWSICRTKKIDQVMEKIFPPENIEGLKVNKVNIEV